MFFAFHTRKLTKCCTCLKEIPVDNVITLKEELNDYYDMYLENKEMVDELYHKNNILKKYIQNKNDEINKLKQEKSLITWSLNKIINENQVDTENIQETINNLDEYKNVSNTHEIMLAEWNINTNKLQSIISFINENNIYTNEQHNNENNCNNLLNEYIEFCNIMDILLKRITQASSNDHVRQIIKNRNKLTVKKQINIINLLLQHI